jgi:uncharacterized protein YndB with AHSA1/START domain
MAEQVQAVRTIAASPDALWKLVSDVTRRGEWSPENTGGVWTKGATGPAVGARFKGTNKNGKRTWSTDCTVTEAKPGESFVFESKAGPLKIARWAYVFQSAGDGCTVTETWTDQRGGTIKFLGKNISGVADRAEYNKTGMEQTLEKLDAVATA